MENITGNLFEVTRQALFCDNIEQKIELVQALHYRCFSGELKPQDAPEPEIVTTPGRPQRPELVAPRDLHRRNTRSRDGRAAMLHAVAHIEYNAINLALDAVYRFRGLPTAYYSDWLQVAVEECHHFNLLRDRMQSIGIAYGDFPAHNGLWEMAVKTAHDPLLRMALVPRVFEARGLDVTPGIIDKFKAAGDTETTSILDIILRDEIGHVRTGDFWFRWICHERELHPETTFIELVESYLPGRVRGPFYENARLQAGFTREELDSLRLLG